MHYTEEGEGEGYMYIGGKAKSTRQAGPGREVHKELKQYCGQVRVAKAGAHGAAAVASK